MTSEPMKYLLAITLIFVDLVSFGYAQRRTAPSQRSSLTLEAKKQAQDAWERYFIRCGQSYFHAEPARRVLGINVSPQMLEEFRGATVQTTSSALSQADLLNGVEWKGTSRLIVRTSRIRFGSSAWEEWRSRSYVFSISLRRQAGGWTISEPSLWGINIVDTSVTLRCAQIPGAQVPPTPAVTMTRSLRPITPGRIVFERWLKCADGSGWGCGVDLWIVNSDGTGLRQLTRDFRDEDPKWSPDGSRIAFERSERYAGSLANEGIHTIKPDGRDLVQVTKHYSDIKPNWLDNKHLLYGSVKGGEGTTDWKLYSVDSDGQNDLLRNFGVRKPFGPAVSIDGRYIAVRSMDGGAFIIALNDGTVRGVEGIDDFPQTWHPDSQRVVLGSGGNCYLTNAANSTTERLQGIDECHLSYSRDGSQIAYQLDDAIWIMNENGDNKTLVAKSRDDSIFKAPVLGPPEPSESEKWKTFIQDQFNLLSQIPPPKRDWKEILNLGVWGQFDSYQELYLRAINRRNLSVDALSAADKFLKAGNMRNVKKYAGLSAKHYAESNDLFNAAERVFANAVGMTAQALNAIYRGSTESSKYGWFMACANPKCYEIADYVFLVTDFAVDSSLEGANNATKELAAKAFVKTLLQTTGVSHLIENRTTHYIGNSGLYGFMDKTIGSPEFQKAMMKFLAESGAHTATRITSAALTKLLISARDFIRQPSALVPRNTSSEVNTRPTLEGRAPDLIAPEPILTVTGEWAGEWNDRRGNVFACEMKIVQDSENNVNGHIVWTLRGSPDPQLQKKIHQTAVEHVSGSYDASKRSLTLRGYRKDDPNTIIALDSYRIFLSADGHTLSGETATNGSWEGRLSTTRKASATAQLIEAYSQMTSDNYSNFNWNDANDVYGIEFVANETGTPAEIRLYQQNDGGVYDVEIRNHAGSLSIGPISYGRASGHIGTAGENRIRLNGSANIVKRQRYWIRIRRISPKTNYPTFQFDTTKTDFRVIRSFGADREPTAEWFLYNLKMTISVGSN